MRSFAPTFLVLTSTLSTACIGTSSNLDVDTPVVLEGTVHQENGTPLANHPVLLRRSADLLENALSILILPYTIASCFSDMPAELCEGAEIATTDDNGLYSFEMLGEDTKTSNNRTRDFFLSSALDPRDGHIEGPTISHQFIINEPNLVLPELTFWNPELALEEANGRVKISVDLAPEDLINVELTNADRVIWSAAENELPTEAFEDLETSIFGQKEAFDTRESTSIYTVYQSGRVPYTGTKVPISRGASCSYESEGHEMKGLASCQLTDGDLIGQFSLPDEDPCSSANFDPEAGNPECEQDEGYSLFLVDLGSAKDFTTILVRDGGPQSIRVETSSDGETWTPFDEEKEGQFNLFSDSANARYVRVHTSIIQSLSEVSVF